MTGRTSVAATRLNRLYNPNSIAVLGASANPGTLGYQVYANLRRDFPGTLYPVNPRSSEVLGDHTYPDVASLPEPVDLVVVLVPATHVLHAVEQSIAGGHHSACVITSGFSETGTDEGRALQQRLVGLASEHGFPIAGPNCVGFMNGHHSIMANFAIEPDSDRPVPGPVALVSQSGGLGSYILNRAVTSHISIGFFASTGNECDVTVADVLRHVVEWPEIQVVGLFAEAIRKPDVFIEAADRAAELGKVIVSVTPGSSETVARAALSHTASIVGSEHVYDAVCRQHGILRAGSIDEMVDFALILQDGRRMAGRRIGVVTASGGAGILIAGDAAEAGLAIPELDAATQARLKTLMPAIGSARNPVDTTPAMQYMPQQNNRQIYELLVAEESIDAVLTLVWDGDGELANDVVDAYKGTTKPVVPVVALAQDYFAQHGIPYYGDPTRAVRALGALAQFSARACSPVRVGAVDAERAARARAILGGVTGSPFLLESTAKDLLSLYGVPVPRETVCFNEEAAVKAARSIGGAVVVKALSYDLPHKSDAGGVVLGVRTEEQVRAAYRQVAALESDTVTIDGALVQEMVSSRLELAVGLQRDAVYGPVVAVGLGGVLIEILGDPQLLHAPFSHQQAREAASGIAGGRILHAKRGLDDAQLNLLATTMTGVGQLALELPEIESVDINPMLVSNTGLCAVDALVVLRES
jgi:acetate---CoA ligase (ADP-forming)